MPLKTSSAFLTGSVAAALALTLCAGTTVAGEVDRGTTAAHRHYRAYPHDPFYPYDPYYPYYYSRYSPYSLYSIYDHLSGGRHLCYLPSDPCDNNHRVTN
jgi:hypothetical protein